MAKELYVTDEFGEVVDIIESTDKYVKLSEGDKVLRKNVLQYLSDTVDLKYQFVKINPFVYGELARKYPILNLLVGYIGYMDGKITYENGKIIKLKDISKLCKVSLSTVNRQIKGLIKEDVLHKVKDKNKNYTYLVMNPYVAYIGRKIYLSLYEEFKFSEFKNKCRECVK